ncbi:MAG: lysylphosphatidylglycerol synthase transmembrane domain-containing protein [Actinomycetota bacterium]
MVEEVLGMGGRPDIAIEPGDLPFGDPRNGNGLPPDANEREADASQRAWWTSAPIQTIVGLVVVGAAFVWGLPSFASYGQVWAALGDLRLELALALVVVGALNLTAPSWSQLAALPGLRFRPALLVDWVTSAVTNAVPGGSALAVGLTWSMYRRIGFGRGAVARSIVVTGVWDIFMKLSLPLLAVAWLSTERPVGPGLIQAAAVGAAFFVVVAVLAAVLAIGPTASAVVGAALDRLPGVGDGWIERLDSMRADTLALVRTRGLRLTFWTLAGHLNVYLLLVLCLRSVGVTSTELSAAGILAAFAFGRLVTALPLTPGGLGVMELGLTGALAAVGSADEAAVVAAVLIFRFATFFLTIPLGLIAWPLWTRSTRRLPPPEHADVVDAVEGSGAAGVDLRSSGSSSADVASTHSPRGALRSR